MKKRISLILCLLLLASLLAACGKDETGTKTYTCENLTLTIPASMKEDKDMVADTGFNFGLEGGGILVLGLREDMSNFSDMTAMEYARLVVQANNLNGVPEDKGDYVLIKYSANVGTEYTYLACIYKNGSEFWMVQAGSFSTVFEKKQDQIMDIVTSGQIN